MPIVIPTLDNRRYQDLLDEALARIPVHNPEWTNFNKSDPGVTLIEVFAFMTETLLYRSNQIPERNRRKFLQLLGVPLLPASSARGLVTIRNENGPLETITLNDNIEVRAGQVPFRTERGLDILPVEAQVYFKRPISNPKLLDHYKLLYASYKGQAPENVDFQLYDTVLLDEGNTNGIALASETVDRSLWIALMVRASNKPATNTEKDREILREEVRRKIAGKTVSIGIVPSLEETSRRMAPGGPINAEGESLLVYELPSLPADGKLPDDPLLRIPQYKTLTPTTSGDVLAEPGTVEITLPSAEELRLWSNLDPLEPGVDKFPPSLEDTKLSDRVVTWLRVRASATVLARILWLGINAVTVSQRAHVPNEQLPDATGEPDQVARVSRSPIVPKSVRLTVSTTNETQTWQEIDDLLSAGPEVKVPDLRQPPGARPRPMESSDVFAVNAESGEIRFGDGFRGRRPPPGARMLVSYDYGVGTAGNVGAGAINTGPSLPAGMKVANPVRTWGGAEAESVTEGEKQIARYLQHRDRLVTAADFETIAARTPGVDLGRVEVLSAFNPELTPSEPGDAPGAVTLMLIPRFDPRQPDAPLPDRPFLDAVCRHLDPRRLVTTELFLRAPAYKPIWVSVGINVLAGWSIADVREAVKAALLQFLAPIRQQPGGGLLDNQPLSLAMPQYAELEKGWPLRKPVTGRELAAIASRVPGVMLVNNVEVAAGTATAQDQIPMTGLELPRVAGILVVVGEPVPIDELRGQTPADDTTPGAAPVRLVPIPIVPEEC